MITEYQRSILDELRPQPTAPCSHWAGSRGKIEMMRARWEAGESLWHPCDASECIPEHAPPKNWVGDADKFGR